ncbi:hypothetical protein J6590_027724 [Homalodisca vitripennis]|nr:hypothetical protein J6590_027724 [Homalodisca vitripennis]
MFKSAGEKNEFGLLKRIELLSGISIFCQNLFKEREFAITLERSRPLIVKGSELCATRAPTLDRPPPIPPPPTAPDQNITTLDLRLARFDVPLRHQ